MPRDGGGPAAQRRLPTGPITEYRVTGRTVGPPPPNGPDGAVGRFGRGWGGTRGGTDTVGGLRECSFEALVEEERKGEERRREERTGEDRREENRRVV
eukprot:763403-Hanusia_phi.AAC.10